MSLSSSTRRNYGRGRKTSRNSFSSIGYPTWINCLVRSICYYPKYGPFVLCFAFILRYVYQSGLFLLYKIHQPATTAQLPIKAFDQRCFLLLIKEICFCVKAKFIGGAGR